MKKYLIIICLFLVSFSAHSLYMSKSDMENCEQIKKVYRHKAKCGNDCVKVPKSHNCETFSEQPTNVDDLEKPKYSKNQLNKCGEYCESLFPDLVCVDSNERPILNLDLEEIYCTKFTGYEQKSVMRFREDAAKKASYEAAKQVLKDEKAADKSKRAQLKSLLDGLKSGTDLTPAQNRKLQIQVIKKLFK